MTTDEVIKGLREVSSVLPKAHNPALGTPEHAALMQAEIHIRGQAELLALFERRVTRARAILDGKLDHKTHVPELDA